MERPYAIVEYSIRNITRDYNIRNSIINFNHTNFDNIESDLKRILLNEYKFKKIINTKWKHLCNSDSRDDYINYKISKYELIILAEDTDGDIIELKADVKTYIESMDGYMYYFEQSERLLKAILDCNKDALERLFKLINIGNLLMIHRDEVIEAIKQDGDEVNINTIIGEYMYAIMAGLYLFLHCVNDDDIIKKFDELMDFHPKIAYENSKFNNILDQIIWDNDFKDTKALLDAVIEKLKEV